MSPRLAKPLSPDCQVTAPAVDSIAELSISAVAEEAGRASAWIETVCLEHNVPAEQIRRLDLCLNEAIANIIVHGGPAALSSPVQLLFSVHRQENSNEAALMVSDSGAAFDPLAYQPKSRPQTLSEAEPGGLGLLMMRSFTDHLDYQYSEGHNQTTFTVRWAEEG